MMALINMCGNTQPLCLLLNKSASIIIANDRVWRTFLEATTYEDQLFYFRLHSMDEEILSIAAHRFLRLEFMSDARPYMRR